MAYKIIKLPSSCDLTAYQKVTVPSFLKLVSSVLSQREYLYFSPTFEYLKTVKTPSVTANGRAVLIITKV